MIAIVTALHVFVCLILIMVILIQGGRGQGLTGPSFGSGNVQSLFGTRAADFITKATSFAAICFLFTCITLNYFEAQRSRSLLDIPRRRAPIDVDAIKKALEKVKSESPAASTAAPAKPAEKASSPAGPVPASAQPSSSNAAPRKTAETKPAPPRV